MTMTSLLWRHLYLERSQSVHYIAQQFSFATRQVLNFIASYEKSEQVQQANVFKRQTLTFHFSTYHHTTLFTFWKGSTIIRKKKWKWKLN